MSATLAKLLKRACAVAAQAVAVASLLGVKWAPVRKVAVGAVAAALVYLARRAGLDLGADSANEAAVAFVGAVAAYLVPDHKS